MSGKSPLESATTATNLTSPKKVRRRKHRSRKLPLLIGKMNDMDIAKRRAVMILEVLSGHTPVTDAIERAKISR
jgi:hypothetical protein